MLFGHGFDAEPDALNADKTGDSDDANFGIDVRGGLLAEKAPIEASCRFHSLNSI